MDAATMIQTLTAAEVSIAERKAGLAITSLEDPTLPKVDLLGALAWVHAKRSEPLLTFPAFMERSTLSTILKALGQDDDEGEDDE